MHTTKLVKMADDVKGLKPHYCRTDIGSGCDLDARGACDPLARKLLSGAPGRRCERRGSCSGDCRREGTPADGLCGLRRRVRRRFGKALSAHAFPIKIFASDFPITPTVR